MKFNVTNSLMNDLSLVTKNTLWKGVHIIVLRLDEYIDDDVDDDVDDDDDDDDVDNATTTTTTTTRLRTLS
ncbi:hypothetical protein V1477_017036 [Vespula maculifrons]|uniref:Uncharacterized protein n=1 Tax=Vespula maculifrons TaxID=7453 RepID=A0ABD2B4V5_VESMC